MWCFGKSILSLKLSSPGAQSSSDIIKYASQYCTKLKKLHISSKSSSIFDAVNSPFAELEELELWNNEISSERLSCLLPKLQRLKCVKGYLKCIQNRFPELKWLGVSVCLLSWNSSHYCVGIMGCIHSCANWSWTSEFFLPRANSCLKRPVSSYKEYLELVGESGLRQPVPVYHFKNVKTFVIRHRDCNEPIFFAFDKLEHLIVDGSCPNPFDAFIERHPSIRQITAQTLIIEKNIINGSVTLPALQEVVVKTGGMKIVKFVSHLVQIETIKRIEFHCLDIEFNSTKRQHGHMWQFERFPKDRCVMQRMDINWSSKKED